MVNWGSRKIGDILKVLIGITAIVWANQLSSVFFVRIDLTEEKRFTIKEATKEMLGRLDEVVYVEVFLDGELNSGFKRLQKAVKETLEEFRIYSDNRIQFTFYDPSAAISEQARAAFMQGIMARGIQPTNVIEERDGNRIEKLIFPGALVSYGGVEEGVMLLKGNKVASAEEKINQSIESIEYALASVVHKLTAVRRKRIGILKGHGVPEGAEMAGLMSELNGIYQTEEVTLQQKPDAIDALLIAKPTKRFSETEKYYLDQYLMEGGNVLLFIDKMRVAMDSASREANYSFPYDLNLDDQLFKYGVRINDDLIQDNSAAGYPVNVGNMGDQPQIKLMKWLFFPMINHFGDHVITRNLDVLLGRFVSTIDTVKARNVRKTPLLFTSDYSRTLSAPVNVSLQSMRKNITAERFGKSQLPVAYLLEGAFTSLYATRLKPDGVADRGFKPAAKPGAKLLVVSDGDMVRNDVNPKTGKPQPLGLDLFTGTLYANQDFALNALNYLIDDDGLITARNKEVKIRPLNKIKIKAERRYWQVMNLVVPIVLLAGYGLARWYWRKRKYARF